MDNRAIALEVLCSTPKIINKIDAKFLDDMDFLIEVVKKNPEALRDMEIPTDWRERALIGFLVKHPEFMQYLPTEALSKTNLGRDRKPQPNTTSMFSVASSWDAPSNIDYYILRNAISLNTIVLTQVPQKILDDKEFIFNVASTSPYVWEHLPNDVKYNEDFILKIAEEGAKQKSEILGNFFMPSLKKIGADHILKFIPTQLSHDRDFALRVIEKNPDSLQYVHEDFRRDSVFLTKAVSKNPEILRDYEVRNDDDKRVILNLLKQNIKLFESIPNSLKEDDDFLVAALLENPEILKLRPWQSSMFVYPLSATEKRIAPIAQMAIEKDPNFVQHLNLSNKNEGDIVVHAITQNAKVVTCLPDSAFKDVGFIRDVIERCPIAFKHISAKIKDDKNMLVGLITHNPEVIKFISEDLSSDYLILARAAKKNPDVIDFIPEEIKNSQKFKSLQAMSQDLPESTREGLINNGLTPLSLRARLGF